MSYHHLVRVLNVLLGLETVVVPVLANGKLVRLTPALLGCPFASFPEHIRRVLVGVMPISALPLCLHGPFFSL